MGAPPSPTVVPMAVAHPYPPPSSSSSSYTPPLVPLPALAPGPPFSSAVSRAYSGASSSGMLNSGPPSALGRCPAPSLMPLPKPSAKPSAGPLLKPASSPAASSPSAVFHVGAPPSKPAPPPVDLVARRQRTIKEGTDAIDNIIGVFPALVPARERAALLASVEAHAKADSFVQDPNMGKRTVVSDGNHAISCKAPPQYLPPLDKTAAYRDPNFVYVSESDITNYCRTIGHVSKNDSLFHADKQLAVYLTKQNIPLPPMGDSRIMCEDCFNFFAKQAEATRQPLYITDPSMIMTFYPDGTVTRFVYKYPEMRQFTELPSTPPDTEKGCVFVTNTKTGVTTKYKPDTTVIEYRPDGSRETRQPNGTIVTRARDGAETEVRLDGTVIEYNRLREPMKETRANGTVITYERTYTSLADDPKYSAQNVETTRETRPDKSALVTSRTTKYLKGSLGREIVTMTVEYNAEGDIIAFDM